MISTLNSVVGKVLFWAIAFVHGVLVVVMFAGVVTRYLLNLPLFWSEEVCLLGLIWLTFLGGAVLVRQDKNICITIFTDLLPVRSRRSIDLLNHPVVIVCLIIMIVQSWKLCGKLSFSTTPALRISETWFGAALVVGFVLMLFYQIQRFIAQLRNRVAFPEEPVCSAEETTGEVCNL